ncbi:MAG: ion channel [Candidatus Woesearchaeota archaeon]
MDNSKRLEQLKSIHKFDERLMNIVTFISLIYMVFLIAELYFKPTITNIAFTILVDTAVCIVFLFEFFYFLFRAKNKWSYTKINFLDFLASLPFLLIFGFFSKLAILNIFKMIRGLKSILKIYEFIGKNKVTPLKKIIIIFVLLIIYFSMSIIYFERQTNPNLNSFEDGLWWAVTTVTTVGYGDSIPITGLGKFVAILLMIIGVGITSAFGAVLVSFLLKPAQIKLQKEEELLLQEEETLQKEEELSVDKEDKIIKEQKKIEMNEEKLMNKLNKIDKEIKKIENNTARKTKTKKVKSSSKITKIKLKNKTRKAKKN